MNLIRTTREVLLKPLQAVAGIIERRAHDRQGCRTERFDLTLARAQICFGHRLQALQGLAHH
jgi:hypothetical protein